MSDEKEVAEAKGRDALVDLIEENALNDHGGLTPRRCADAILAAGFTRRPAEPPHVSQGSVRAEVGRLRTALLRYGVHRHHCATSLTPPQGGAVPVCNCGLHDALAPNTEGQ